jgi:[ribosomal protein S5]-alanine N-acetyltransferase
MEDADVIFEKYAQDPEVTKYLTWRPHRNLGETREFLQASLVAWREGRSYHWTIVRKENQELMGMITARVENHKWEIGYVLARAYWGKGYMTEALRELVAWGLEQPEITRIWSVCDIENRASARVMEKASMRREGTLPRWSVHPNLGPEPRDSYCYSVGR